MGHRGICWDRDEVGVYFRPGQVYVLQISPFEKKKPRQRKATQKLKMRGGRYLKKLPQVGEGKIPEP